MPDPLWPHGLQHDRPPCPSPTPGAHSNSWPLMRWMMPSNCLILWCPFLLLPSIFPSIRVFSSESALHIRWPKYWSFSFRISPSNEYSGLVSFRMDWLDLLAVQGTLKSLLQHHSSKASILQHSSFFVIQLSHPHVTTGKTIALTRRTFVGKVMYLLSNMLSRLVIAFLPRSKHLLISCLQSPSAVIFLQKIIFLEFSCFFNDPTDVGNLISGSSGFSKSSLHIWKFMVHVLLKPGLENFEHYFASVWDERNCAVVWAFFGIAFLWGWNENWPFPVLWPLLFSKFADIMSAALSQHHLWGFEIAQLEFHHLH